MLSDSLDLRVGRRRLRFEVLLAATVLLTHSFAAVAPLNSLLYWFPTDDAFYYFRVARHITAGDGVTFDGFNPANGFHPLWMLICLPLFALAKIDAVLPLRLLVLVMAALNAATAVLLYRLLARRLHPLAAALVGTIWAFTPTIHAVTTLRGMESGIGAFALVLLLTVLEAHDRRGWQNLTGRDHVLFSLAAALVLFSRLDNIFLAAAAGVWIMFRRGSLGGYALAILTAGAASVFTAFFLRLGFVPEFPEYLPGLVIYLALSLTARLPIYYLFGMQRRPCGQRWLGEALRAAAAAGLASGAAGMGMIILSFLGWNGNFPRAVILVDALLSLAGLILIRGTAGLFDRSKQTIDRAAGWAGLRQAFPTWVSTAAAYALPLGLLLGGYVLWNQLNFGTFMPVSGQIKHWWGQTGDTIYGRPVQSLAGLFGLASWDSGPWALLWAPFNSLTSALGIAVPWAGAALAGVVYAGLLLWNRRGLRGGLNGCLALLFAAGLIQVLYYNGTYYVNLRPWYWVNQMLFIVLFWALLVDALLWRMNQAVGLRRALCPLAAAAAAVLVAAYGVYQFRLVPLSAGARSTYPDLAEAQALEEMTEPGARIGMTGGGVVAYFIHDRTIVNLDGLMNSPAYFRAIKAGQGREMVDSFGLDYVFGGEYILLHSNPYYFSLADRLVEIAPLGGGYVYTYRR